jgi:excisionase family DNA binding protein
MGDPYLVRDEEAARLLSISRSKFHLLVADGLIERLKIGRSARYRRVDVVAYADGLAEAHGSQHFDRTRPQASDHVG